MLRIPAPTGMIIVPSVKAVRGYVTSTAADYKKVPSLAVGAHRAVSYQHTINITGSDRVTTTMHSMV